MRADLHDPKQVVNPTAAAVPDVASLVEQIYIHCGT